MQFFIPLALSLAAVVAAQDPNCDAAPIVEVCLTSENKKVEDCAPTDYDCQCAAYQAVATCYNNCPKDPRAGPANQQVTIFCSNASIHGSAAMRKTMTSSAASGSATAAVATSSSGVSPTRSAANNVAASSTSDSSSTATGTPNMGVGQLARNTGGVLLAVAGVVAAVL